MRAQSPIPVIAMASIAPVLTLIALILNDERLPVTALRPTELPETSAAFAVTLAPLLCAIVSDRARPMRIAATLIAALTIAAGAIAAASICRGLYPPSVDMVRLGTFSLVTSLAATGIALGMRSVGMRPGSAVATIMTLYALPPFVFYISAELAFAPLTILRSASPMWAYLGDSSAPWEFAIFGAFGLLLASAREWRLKRRLRTMRAHVV